MKVRRFLAAVLAALLAVTLTSCTASRTVTVSSTDREATLHPGDVLVVDFGEINSSVGDAWEMTTRPDGAVLTGGERDSRYLGEEGMTGAPEELSYRFTAKSAGVTSIEFEYMFRGEVPADPAERATVSITVTVE